MHDNAAFIVMPYTNNDENDHAYTYGIQAALQKLNIRCVRADDRVIPGQLLENIRGYAVLLFRFVAEDNTAKISDAGLLQADMDKDGLFTIIDVAILLKTLEIHTSN